MADEQPIVPEGAHASDGTDGTTRVEDVDLSLYEGRPQQGIFGFTLREVLIVGVWLVAFILSFFPLLGEGLASVWNANLSWLLPIGLPTVAVFLLVLRRLSPEGIRRVGSLGIDQFASVAFSVSAVSWGVMLWQHIRIALAIGESTGLWAVALSFLAHLALVALTVCAPLIPGIRDDFEHRFETLAHRAANPVRPVIREATPRRQTTTDAHSVISIEPDHTVDTETDAEASTEVAEPDTPDPDAPDPDADDTLSHEER